MSVLGVADATRPSDQQPSVSGVNTNDQSGDETERVDIAERLSDLLEDFLNSVIPSKKRIEVDWGSLSPVFGVVGDVFAVGFTIWRWFL